MHKCDACKLMKSPIIYVRSSRKLCQLCHEAERMTVRSMIDSMLFVIPWEPFLGYNFVLNEWFSDQSKGRKYTDYVYTNFGSASN